MKTTIRTALCATAMLLGLAVSTGVSAQEGQSTPSTCETPGSTILTGVPSDAASLVPSLRKELGGYGRAAKKATCKIALVCVAADGSETARESARTQCVVARDVLVRAGFVKADIATSRRGPGGPFRAGTVQMSFY